MPGMRTRSFDMHGSGSLINELGNRARRRGTERRTRVGRATELITVRDRAEQGDRRFGCSGVALPDARYARPRWCKGAPGWLREAAGRAVGQLSIAPMSSRRLRTPTLSNTDLR